MKQQLQNLYNNTVQKYPLIAIILLALCVGGLATQISKLRFDASSDSLVVEGDQALALFRDVNKRYSTEDFLVVTYTPKAGLFSQPVLDEIAALQKDLSELGPVSSINSILNVPLLYSPKVTLTTLNDGIKYLSSPDTDRKLAAKEFLESPIYNGLLTSPDESTTVLQVNLKRQTELETVRVQREDLRAKERAGTISSEESTTLEQVEKDYEKLAIKYSDADKQLVIDTRAVLDKYRAKGNAELFLGGLTMVTSDMLNYIKNDLTTFGIAIFLFVIFVLSIVFRQFRWVVLPMTACAVTVLITTGLMAIFGWNLTVISANFVALLLILTLSVTVHLVVRYRELEISMADKSNAERVRQTVIQMFKPCLYTTLTTLVAFASLVVSGIRPVIDFGWMMTLGVVIALVVTFIVLPAGALLWKSKPLSAASAGESTPPITGFIANFCERFATPILIISAILAAFALYGLTKLKVENRFIDYFDKSTEIYQGMEKIDSELGGVIPLDIIVRKPTQAEEEDFYSPEGEGDDFGDVSEIRSAEAGSGGDDFADVDEPQPQAEGDDFDDFGDVGEESANKIPENDWFNQAGLDEVKKIHNFINGLDETGKTLSLATLYQVTEDILESRVDDIQLALLEQKVTSDIRVAMIDPYLDAANNETRITVRVKETSENLNRNELIKKVDTFLSEEMGYSKENYDLTGLLVLYNNMLQSLFKSQILTLGAVFIAIVLMFLVLFRSLSIALIAILPNLLAAGLVLACMGYLAIPLDMMTITIAAITVGIGVDNSIHYIYRFKDELTKDNDYLKTMHRSHRSIGRAMFYTSITIIVGFSILVLSNFTPSLNFGLLTSIAMSSALLGNLLLLPQLLIKLKPFKTA